jgi:uncharacterized protein (DUF111 family)
MINGTNYIARVKVSRRDQEILSIKPEYEDCKRIAEETAHPLRAIMKKVEEAEQRSQDI